MANVTLPIGGIILLAALANERAHEAAAIAPCLLPHVRTSLRDQMIRVAVPQFYAGMPKTSAAKKLALDMAGAPRPGAKSARVAAIVAMNGGRLLSWRQIVNVIDGVTRHCQTGTLQDLAKDCISIDGARGGRG